MVHPRKPPADSPQHE